jgi:hypothetical protein
MAKAPVQSSTQPERPKALDTLIARAARRAHQQRLQRAPNKHQP